MRVVKNQYFTGKVQTFILFRLECIFSLYPPSIQTKHNVYIKTTYWHFKSGPGNGKKRKRSGISMALRRELIFQTCCIVFREDNQQFLNLYNNRLQCIVCVPHISRKYDVYLSFYLNISSIQKGFHSAGYIIATLSWWSYL